MICKNPYCGGIKFIAVLEIDIVIGLKCFNCGARYSIDEDIEIKKSLKRTGWNSVRWKLRE